MLKVLNISYYPSAQCHACSSRTLVCQMPNFLQIRKTWCTIIPDVPIHVLTIALVIYNSGPHGQAPMGPCKPRQSLRYNALVWIFSKRARSWTDHRQLTATFQMQLLLGSSSPKIRDVFQTQLHTSLRCLNNLPKHGWSPQNPQLTFLTSRATSKQSVLYASAKTQVLIF